MTNKMLRLGLAIGAMSMMTSARAESPSLFVYDSAGHLVGPQSTPGIVNLVLKGTTDPVSINVSVTRLGVSVPVIYYATKDCSGALYFNDYKAFSLVRPAFLGPMQDSLIFPDFSKPGVPVASLRYSFDSFTSCFPATRGVVGVPALSASLSGQGFTPPFQVREQ